MFWPPRDSYPYDEPFRSERDLERLRHLVFLDGRLIDTWTEPVERTAYRSIAEEFDREKRVPHYEPPTPLPPPYERVLTWLDSVVGGRVALLALDDEPLPERPAPTGDDTVDELIARVADALLRPRVPGGRASGAGDRAPWTTRTCLPRRRRARSPRDSAGSSAGRTVWSGPGHRSPRRPSRRRCGSARHPRAESRASRSACAICRPRHCVRPSECPELLELGNPTYLTSATRRRLIVLRDRALAAAERAEADQQAREALTPGRVANLTS